MQKITRELEDLRQAERSLRQNENNHERDLKALMGSLSAGHPPESTGATGPLSPREATTPSPTLDVRMRAKPASPGYTSILDDSTLKNIEELKNTHSSLIPVSKTGWKQQDSLKIHAHIRNAFLKVY